MNCQTCARWCGFCGSWRIFYRYLDGTSREWICQSCGREYRDAADVGIAGRDVGVLFGLRGLAAGAVPVAGPIAGGSIMNWWLKRLQEPSTWRGIVWLATALGVTLKPMAWEYIMSLGMAAAGLLGVLLSDAATPAPAPEPLPPIDLQARPGGADPGGAGPAAGELRNGVPTVPNFGVRPPIDRGLDDQFSGGWGDR